MFTMFDVRLKKNLWLKNPHVESTSRVPPLRSADHQHDLLGASSGGTMLSRAELGVEAPGGGYYIFHSITSLYSSRCIYIYN